MNQVTAPPGTPAKDIKYLCGSNDRSACDVKRSTWQALLDLLERENRAGSSLTILWIDCRHMTSTAEFILAVFSDESAKRVLKEVVSQAAEQ